MAKPSASRRFRGSVRMGGFAFSSVCHPLPASDTPPFTPLLRHRSKANTYGDERRKEDSNSSVAGAPRTFCPPASRSRVRVLPGRECADPASSALPDVRPRSHPGDEGDVGNLATRRASGRTWLRCFAGRLGEVLVGGLEAVVRGHLWRVPHPCRKPPRSHHAKPNGEVALGLQDLPARSKGGARLRRVAKRQPMGRGGSAP